MSDNPRSGVSCTARVGTDATVGVVASPDKLTALSCGSSAGVRTIVCLILGSGFLGRATDVGVCVLVDFNVSFIQSKGGVVEWSLIARSGLRRTWSLSLARARRMGIDHRCFGPMGDRSHESDSQVPWADRNHPINAALQSVRQVAVITCVCLVEGCAAL